MREEWSLDEYDVQEIHRKSVDGRGHSYKANIRFPDHWAGMIGEMVGSGDYPEYRTTHDFVRDAVYHRLHYWSTHDRTMTPEILRAIKRERMIAVMRRGRGRVIEFEDFMKELEDTTHAMARAEDWDTLAKKLGEIEDEAREVYDGPYLDRVLERIGYWRKRSDRTF